MNGHVRLKPDISVIIVNYRTADLAIAAVESVLARTHGGRSVDVHLIDNGSAGDDGETLRAAHEAKQWGGRVTLHLESENHGFGRGNNVVLEALARRPDPPSYVFLLNPDARLDNEAIDILATFLDDTPSAAAAGASVVRPDGERVTAAFRFPGAASEFATACGLGFVSRLLRDSHVAMPADLGRQPVDWVTGAGFMMRFDALRQVGFFDPDFFLYFEETELLWRLRKTGHAIWYVPEARVVHVAGAATGMKGGRVQDRPQPGYWYDSWRLYHVKTRGRTGARLVALARLGGALVNVLQNGLRGRGATLPARFFPDFGRFVLTPLFLGDPLLARPDGKTVRGRR
ncbi:putative glycosyltransferase [Sphingobium sp. SYK-6]|uniref:glycosyltransferase family 2 protein n=1 Tax=Sphingobium sp. (strain NBRC 103272 / SYK-6) TaxID=627192 RepID=UPI00022779F7|nr:glycosyltransferase family 2 protein [Sphingobium sp. SYK-6]BAK68099.1 putative glycosyltransferase [Sphingobium sp. SYK-6]